MTYIMTSNISLVFNGSQISQYYCFGDLEFASLYWFLSTSTIQYSHLVVKYSPILQSHTCLCTLTGVVRCIAGGIVKKIHYTFSLHHSLYHSLYPRVLNGIVLNARWYCSLLLQPYKSAATIFLFIILIMIYKFLRNYFNIL